MNADRLSEADATAELQSLFARRVHDRLEQTGDNTEGLASATGIAVKRISRILNGQGRRVSLLEMGAIATALGSQLSDLLSD